MRSYPRNSPKAAARADPHLVDAETVGLEAARHHWQLADGDKAHTPISARRHAA